MAMREELGELKNGQPLKDLRRRPDKTLKKSNLSFQSIIDFGKFIILY